MVTPGYGGKLLLQPKTWIRGTDSHGHEWITDRFVLGRSECFRTLPKSTDSITPDGIMPKKVLRNFLAKIRSVPVTESFAVDSMIRGDSSLWGAKNPAAMLYANGLCSWVNLTAYLAWSKTGLKPRLSLSGHVSWYGQVRHQPTLMAVLMPIRMTGTSERWLTESGRAS